MECLIMIVRYHHAEIILGSQRAHLVLNDCRQLELLQADAGIIMQRLHTASAIVAARRSRSSSNSLFRRAMFSTISLALTGV